MRVLILHSRYRSGPVSGENRVVDDEVRLLRDAGHDVELFDPSAAATGVLGLAAAAASTIWSLDASREVARRIARRRPDLVHVHNLFPVLSPAVLRALPDDLPCVMTLHNYRLLCLPATFQRSGRICEDCVGRLPWPGVLHRCYQGSALASGVLASSLTLHRTIGSFRRVDMYVAISGFVRDKHVEAGLQRERFVVKPHFAWPAPQRRGPGTSFLYLGRLSPEKGVGTLLEAFRGVDAQLLVVGDGPDAADLRRRAPANVIFAGAVDADVVPSYIEDARAVLVPSMSHEGAGKVVLEAYASGVPVVASRVGGLPEVVIDGETGLLVRASDTEEWTRAVTHLSNDDLSVKMGAEARSLWQQGYGPERGLANLERVYRRAIKERLT